MKIAGNKMTMLNLVLTILSTSNEEKIGFDFDNIQEMEKERKKILKFLKRDVEEKENKNEKN